MPKLICPVCGDGLLRREKSWTCDNGHNFDISKQGYVNLLLSSGKGKRHGDDRLMVKARKAFLDKGFYDKLSDLISELVYEHLPDGGDVIDAGCGECKYTFDVQNGLRRKGKTVCAAGIDISKEALAEGAKRLRGSDTILAVASAKKMPFPDKSADVIISIFAPFEAAEFYRVLRDGGCVIRAVPLEKHLWELKKLIYDRPYENPVADLSEAGFAIGDRRELKYRISLDSREDIENLFKMTPYYYKTGRDDQLKLEQASYLETSVEFGVLIYNKEEK